VSNELGCIRLCTPKFLSEWLLKCPFMTCYIRYACGAENAFLRRWGTALRNAIGSGGQIRRDVQ
jgi:hypothetical protein